MDIKTKTNYCFYFWVNGGLYKLKENTFHTEKLLQAITEKMLQANEAEKGKKRLAILIKHEFGKTMLEIKQLQSVVTAFKTCREEDTIPQI